MLNNNLNTKPNDHWMVPYTVIHVDRKSKRFLHQILWDFFKAPDTT